MLQSLPKKILTRMNHTTMSPVVMLDELDIRPGSRLLEVGLPVGFFAPAALAKVGPSGAVYVAGPSHEALSKLSHLMHHAHLHVALLADLLVGESVPHGSIDTVLLTNLLSKSTQPHKFCMALGPFLHNNSEIVLIDWDTQIENVGPEMAARVTKEEAIKLLASCGLVFKRLLKTPGYHYGLVFGLH